MPRWVDRDGLLKAHRRQVEKTRESDTIISETMLESALGRPRGKFEYANCEDIPTLAAAYCYGITKNHPFFAGNKRAAFLAATAFIEANGYRFSANWEDAAETIEFVSEDKISEQELAEWIRANSVKQPDASREQIRGFGVFVKKADYSRWLTYVGRIFRR